MSEAVQLAMITVLATIVTVGFPLLAGIILTWMKANAAKEQAATAAADAKKEIASISDKQDVQHDAWNSRLDEFKEMVIAAAQEEVAKAEKEFEAKLMVLRSELASLKK